MRHILITGSEGLIGHAMVSRLLNKGFKVTGVDLKDPTFAGGIKGDILDAQLMQRMVQGVDGLLHLAAVSRVIDGEKNPELCVRTNKDATEQLLNLIVNTEKLPWFIYASSREVYGEPEVLPVTEDSELKPVNIYGHSKLSAEEATSRYPSGFIVRFSNVYGSVHRDHATRVIPAFTRAAAEGRTLMVEGGENTFDFTHLDDTCDGVEKVIEKAEKNIKLPPLHFVGGRATSLFELATLAIGYSDRQSETVEAPARNFDVSHFQGSYQRAQELLNWSPRITLEQGIQAMVKDWSELNLNSAR